MGGDAIKMYELSRDDLGECTALLDGRTNAAPCSDLAGGQVGLYIPAGADLELITANPWRLIAPESSWHYLSIGRLQSPESIDLLRAGRPAGDVSGVGDWHTTAGELRAIAGEAILLWPNPLAGDFHLEADLRRPGRLL